MWKRVLVVIIALVGTFSVVYATNTDLFATTTTYKSGGAVTGRVNKVPSNLTIASGNTSIGMQKGDKVLIGEKNPLDNTPLGFQLLQYHQNYTDYGNNLIKTSGAIGGYDSYKQWANEYLFESPANNTPVNGWLSLSSKPTTTDVNYMNSYDTWYWFGGHSPEIFNGYGGQHYYYIIDINNTSAYINNKTLFDNIDNKTNYKIILDRDLTTLRSKSADVYSVNKMANQNSLKHVMFLLSSYEANSIEPKDLTLSTGYWLDAIPYGSDYTSGKPTGFSGDYIDIWGNTAGVTSFEGKAPFRPALYLNMDKVVFATSMGNTTGLANITQSTLSNNYSSIYEETKNAQDMKVRVLNSALTATLTGLFTKNEVALVQKNEMVEAETNSTIKIGAEANSYSNSTVSVLLFDLAGNFRYYKPLEPAKGNGYYTFDSTGILAGEYQIGIVNEIYNDSSQAAADCSNISYVGKVRFVKPMSFTTANSESTYTYKSNVNPSSTVAKINYSDGAGYPTFTITANSKAGHTNDYLNFVSTTDTTTSPVDIKVKSDAPDLLNGSLPVGDYYFNVQGVDGNGDSLSTKEVHITVNKATSTLTDFDNTKKTIYIGDNTAYLGTLNTNNTDLTSSITPTYTLTSSGSTPDESGAIRVISTSAKTFNVNVANTYTANDLPKSVFLNVQIPATDNFNASTSVQKEFYVYRELSDLIFTSSATGNHLSKETISGYSFGYLSSSNGIPNITYAKTTTADSGGYDATNAANNNAIDITYSDGKYKVIANQKLDPGTYKFQFKSTDSTNKTIYKNVEVTVSKDAGGTLEFKDKSASSTIDKLSLEYSQSTNKPSVYAEGGASIEAVIYSLATDQPSDVTDPTSILTVDPSTGEITMHKVGTVNVTATKPGGTDYEDLSVTIPVTISEGKQSIKFKSYTANQMLDKGSMSLETELTRTDKSTTTETTYTSSTTDVCDVDSSSGKVTFNKAGACSIKVENNEENYTSTSDTASITIYDAFDAKFEAKNVPQANVAKADTVVGKLTGMGGNSEFTYEFKNTDNALLSLTVDGNVVLKKDLVKEDIATKQKADGTYVIKDTVIVEDGIGNSKDVDIEIVCKGAALNAKFNYVDVKNTIHKSYSPSGNFSLSVDSASSGTITYSKLEDTDSLLTDVSSSGLVEIAKAGTTAAKVQAVISPKDGYDGETITANIVIDPVTQNIAFAVDTPTKKYLKDKAFDVVATISGRTDGSTPSGVTYSSSTLDVCTVDSAGEVTIKTAGTCKIEASNEDANYVAVSATKDIIIYGDLSANFEQTRNPVAVGTPIDTPIGTIKDQIGGMNPYTYEMKNASTLIKINDSGIVSLAKQLEVTDLRDKYSETNHRYEINETIIMKDANNESLEIPVTIICKGATLNAEFSDEVNGTITKTYENGGFITLQVKNNLGGGVPIFEKIEDQDGVIGTVNPTTGLVSIVKAGTTAAKVKAEIPASNGYEAQTVNADVSIKKATQNIRFEPVLPTSKQYDQDSTFKVNAVADVAGTTITYTTSPSTVCTNNGDTITMVGAGDCTVKATGTVENYEEAKTPDTKITFFTGVNANFEQTATNLQAKQNDATIPDTELPVGVITKEGGLGTITYAISSNVGDLNKAGTMFSVDESGNVSLIHDLKASDLVTYGVYDAENNIYLLKFQVDVLDNGVVGITKDFAVKMQGASLSLSFTDATSGTITKTYSPLGFFDLAIQGNLTNASPTYTYKSGQALSISEIEDIIKLNGKRITIQNADTKMPIIMAEVPASDGYAKTQVDVNIKIDKAEQTNFAFTETKDTISLELDGRLTLNFTPNESGEAVVLTSGDETLVTIDTDGKTIIASSTNTGGPVTISATAPGNRNYIEKIVTKQVVVFGALSGDFKQTLTPQVDVNASLNKTVGSFTVTGGLDEIGNVNVTWADETLSSLLKLVETSTPGAYEIKLKKTLSIDDIKTLYDATSKKYLIPASITISDSSGTATIPASIEIIGAQLSDIAFSDAVNGKITKEFEEGGAFPLSLVDDTFKNVTFKLSDESTTDVIFIGIEASKYMAYIENATQVDDPAVEVIATIPAQNGYASGTMSCIVEITKANQDFDFKNLITQLKLGSTYIPTFTSTPKGDNRVPTLSTVDNTIIAVEGKGYKGKALGTTIISASAEGGRNYEDKTATREVTVYDNMSIIFTPDATLPQAETTSGSLGSVVGSIQVSGGLNALASLNDTLQDNQYFEITSGNVVGIKKDILASDLASKTWNEERQAYEMKIEFTLSDDTSDKVQEIKTIYVKGAPIQNLAFKDEKGNAITDKITKTYAKNGTFTLRLMGDEDWKYGAISYSLKENLNLLDVVSMDNKQIVHILNANPKDSSEKVMALATIAPGNGYEGATLEKEIYIEKAPQPGFAFNSDLITVEKNAGFEPVFKNLLSTGNVEITFQDSNQATYDKNTNKITATGETIVYAMTNPNDRNYTVANAQATIKIKEEDDYVITIQVPEPVTYGSDDTNLKAVITYRGNSATPVESHWMSSVPEVATIDDTGKITIHHVGVTLLHYEEKINVNNEEFVVSQSLKFTVKPKPITVVISDKEKYVGQNLPAFSLEPVVGLVGSDTIAEPIYGCQDSNGDYVDPYTRVGSYDIDGYFDTNANPDYKITLEKGTLTIKQDPSKPSWYQVVSDTQPTESGWYNKPVTLKLIQEESYDKISDNIKGPWDETIIVDEEGIQDKDVYFKDTITSAIAAPQEQTVKVDETAPQVTRIAENETNSGSVAKLLNTITLKQFFKPGSEITIQAEDVLPNADVAISDIAKIDYKIYKATADETGNTLVKEGSETANKAIVAMSEVGDYKVCAIATDNAGNASKEVCQTAEVKKIDVDVDGDGKLDFNDSNNDGCPDLNIKWKDKDGKTWVIMNGDRDYDGIPDLNIDSDGDGQADLNIDTDHDGSPDLNLVVLSKKDWTTESMSHCVISQPEEYCTGTTVKAVMNVDKDGDLSPDYNIDTNGDMKADINITKEGNDKPYVNIMLDKHIVWKPEKSLTSGNFSYDSMELSPEYNIDSVGDLIPDLTIDVNDDGLPDINIDIDGDGIPDTNIDGDGDGKADYNVDEGSGTPIKNQLTLKEWKPDLEGNINDFIFKTMKIDVKDRLEDQGIVVKKPDGTFLPNFYLRVFDVKDTISKDVLQQLNVFVDEDTEIKDIYNIQLYQDDVVVNPDGALLVQLPYKESYKDSLQVILEQKDTSYKKITYERVDEYIQIETDYLGNLGVIAKKDESSTPDVSKPVVKDPETTKPEETIKDETITSKDPSKDTVSGVGGAMSGDDHEMSILFIATIGSLLSMMWMYRRNHKQS